MAQLRIKCKFTNGIANTIDRSKRMYLTIY